MHPEHEQKGKRNQIIKATRRAFQGIVYKVNNHSWEFFLCHGYDCK